MSAPPKLVGEFIQITGTDCDHFVLRQEGWIAFCIKPTVGAALHEVGVSLVDQDFTAWADDQRADFYINATIEWAAANDKASRLVARTLTRMAQAISRRLLRVAQAHSDRRAEALRKTCDALCNERDAAYAENDRMTSERNDAIDIAADLLNRLQWAPDAITVTESPEVITTTNGERYGEYRRF